MATNLKTQNISSIKLGDITYNVKSIPFHGTEEEWNSSGYIPKAGEIIIYDTDADHIDIRLKVGDGATSAAGLDFYGYILPIASESSIGGIKGGGDVTINSSGEISINNDSHSHSDSTITSLDASKLTGLIPSAILPSYVDDVIEGSNMDSFPITGEIGKIYVDISTNKTYRWGGSQYVEISESLALGETAATAYRGDRGAAAYEHAVTNKGAVFPSGLYKITTNNEGHVINAEVVSKDDITELGIPAQDTVYTLPVAGVELGGIKSGEDITINAEGKVSINDDSHNHTSATISSVDASKISSGILPAARLPAATESTQGAITSAMVTKLNGITESADSVSFSQTQSSGVEIGKITINGIESPLYAPTNVAAATNSDNLKITEDNSSTAKLPILFSAATPTSGDNAAVAYNTNVSVLPSSGVLYGAAWNDYAEYRKLENDEIIPGKVVSETGHDSVKYTTSRLEFAPAVISDTYGMVIGEDGNGNVPLAIGGKVLVYSYEDKNSYRIGDAFCSGPNGTISRMTRQEIRDYPDRILGYYVGVPKEQEFNNIPVNGRIWIRIK